MRYRVCISLCFVLFCATGTPPGRADDIPTPGALRVSITTAEGTRLTNYRDTITGHGSGGDIMGVEFVRDGNERVVYSSNSVQTEEGTYAGSPWEQDENGVTIAADDLPDEPHTATVTHDSAAGTYVLANLTKDGYGTRTTVDASTYRVRRVEYVHGWGTTTIDYTASGTFGGHVLATAWTVTTKQSGVTSTADYTRTAVVLGDVTPDQVAEPQTPDLVTFPPGVQRVQIPTSFDRGAIFVHATVAGASTLFLLDSGSSNIIISPGLAKRLGLKLTKAIRTTIARQVDVQQTVIPVIQIGPLEMHNVVAEVVPVGTYGFQDTEFGLLGFDFLATLAVSIDHLHKNVTVQSGWDFKEPDDPAAFPIDVNLSQRVPIVSAVINGAPSHRLIVDTGGNGITLLLFDYFSRQHPEVFDNPGFQQLFFSGVGGGFETKAYGFRSVKLGKLVLENFNAYRTAGKSSYPYDLDGIFGNEFLQHFNIDLDYVHGQIVLRQAHDGGLLRAGR